MAYKSFLARQRTKEICSRGENTRKEIEEVLNHILSGEDESRLTNIEEIFSLFQHHTHKLQPPFPGMYLKLLHGRSPADRELEEWGSEGPWIGPLKWFHCTYLSTFSLGFANGSEYLSTGYDPKSPEPIYFYGGMVYFDGVYYGDWEVQSL